MTVAAPTAAPSTLQVSVVIPCLDEAETIAECVTTARAVLDERRPHGEVIVVDNGSTDGSGDLARAAGALVVEEPRRGYGSAYLAGLAAARGDYIVMVDADLTYDFREIPRFVQELEDGAQLVVGNRLGGVAAGRDALAEPARQPASLRASSTFSTGRTSTTRTAGCARSGGASCRSSTCGRSAWSSRRRW